MPRDQHWRAIIRDIYAEMIEREGLKLLGWRDVPTDNSTLGESVKPTEPVHQQVFIGLGEKKFDEDEFERQLYILRKQISNAIYRRRRAPAQRLLSGVGLVPHGGLQGHVPGRPARHLLPRPARSGFRVSALALVHQRFSTNTFPAWSLAHPYRMIAHNGEINTLRGNVNWMAARQASVSSPLFGDDIKKLWPISYEGQSDTACFDNALEFLTQGGYSLAHAMMMMIPEAWAGNPLMDEERRAFYEYNAALMEPWDGPAAIAFTNGRQIGATLDRNGLRPARYFLTDDDRIVMASEMGVLPIAEKNIIQKWRLQPGKMLLVDLDEGRLIPDEELKATLAQSHPYQEWLDQHADQCSRTCRRPKTRGAEVEPVAARSPAGLRLHPGRPQAPDDADGLDRRGSDRLHGQRHADLGAVGPAEAALHLFQAELRAGHQSADRSDPRGAGDEPRLDHRAAAEPARPGRRLRRSSGSRCASRSSPTRTWRRSARSPR